MSYKLMLCMVLLFVLAGCFDSRLTLTVYLDNPREIGDKIYVTPDGYSSEPKSGAVETRNHVIESRLVVENRSGEVSMPILFMPRRGFMGRPYLEPLAYNYWHKSKSGHTVTLKVNSNFKNLVFLLKESPSSEMKMYRIKMPEHDSIITIPDLPRLDGASESIKQFANQHSQPIVEYEPIIDKGHSAPSKAGQRFGRR